MSWCGQEKVCLDAKNTHGICQCQALLQINVTCCPSSSFSPDARRKMMLLATASCGYRAPSCDPQSGSQHGKKICVVVPGAGSTQADGSS